MARLLIRDLEDDVMLSLRQQAKRYGHSLEELALDILRDGLKHEKESNGGLGARMTPRSEGVDLKEGEEIPEFRGSRPQDPFDE